MQIKLELRGGYYDGAVIEGDGAEFYFRMTNGGTVGKRFWIAPQAGLQRIEAGGKWVKQPSANKYEITERVEISDSVLVSAKFVEPAGQT